MGRIDDAINGSAYRSQAKVKRAFVFIIVLLVLFFSLPVIIINWDYDKWSKKHNEEAKQLMKEISEGEKPSSHR